MKKYATSLILWASLLISELHTLFGSQLTNWILAKRVDMPLNWNIKYATDELWFVMMGFAILFYTPNRINRASVISYIVFCIIDLLMYFVNYKTEGYGAIYTALLITWIIVYNHGSKHRTGMVSKV